MENFQFFLGLRSVQLGKMRLQPSGLTLFPVLFEVESQRQKKQLCPHILFASCEESAETKVVLQKAKGTFNQKNRDGLYFIKSNHQSVNAKSSTI